MNDIILDARMIRHSGIGTYVRGLLEGFQGHPFFDEHPLALATSSPLFAECNGSAKKIVFRSPIYSLWEQAEYPLRMSACRLWHAPHYNIPLMKGKARLVVTIHDLIHWIFQKEFYSSAHAVYSRIFFGRLTNQADKIIAVSQRTRDDLIHHFRVPEKKIRVIYEGVSGDFFQNPDLKVRNDFLSKNNLPHEFFLYVGLMKPHKNVNRLLRVFRKLRSEGKIQLPLVMVGKKDKKYPKGQELTEDLATGEGIFYLPQVSSQAELACLYSAAKALIHPSLYEGFGLTCLEAMASGTPLAVSRAASLPEVVGEAGHYFDPYSDDSLGSALIAMEENENLRKQLGRKGKERARQFHWKKTAEETIEVYREVLRS